MDGMVKGMNISTNELPSLDSGASESGDRACFSLNPALYMKGIVVVWF